MRRGLAALAALALAGCEGGGDPVEQALRDAAAANHAAATEETDLDAAPAPTDAALVRRLTESERQALAAAEDVLGRATDPELRRLAEAARDAHRARIAQLEAWRAPA